MSSTLMRSLSLVRRLASCSTVTKFDDVFSHKRTEGVSSRCQLCEHVVSHLCTQTRFTLHSALCSLHASRLFIRSLYSRYPTPIPRSPICTPESVFNHRII